MTARTVLTRLIELTSNVTDAFTTALYVAQADQPTLQLREHLSLSQHIDPNSKISVGQGPLGQVAQDKRPYLEDFSCHSAPDLPLYTRPEEVKGMMAVPVVGGGVEGVLMVDTKQQYGFSNKQQKILAGLADQIAWHLNQEEGQPPVSAQTHLKGSVTVMDGLPGQGPLRHHPSGLAGLGQTPWEPSLPGNEIRRNGNGHHDAAARTGTSFHEVMDWCRSLADVEDRSLLAERVVDAPETVAPCDAVAVVWFSGETGRVHRSRGWTQELRTVCVRAGRGFAGSCAKTRKAMLLPDTNGRRVVVFAEDESPARFGSLLAAPILVQDELKGVIVCASRQPRGLTPRDQDTWTLIAAFMANALKCAEIQSQWEYDKNLCQVTGVPNHRFLSTYLRSVEAEVFRENRQVFVLTTQLRELHAIYRDYGVEAGDALLRQAISLLSQSVTTPKYIFKYSESAIVLVLMDITADQARGLSTRVRQIFRQGLAAIENQPLDPDARLGLAIHPADGRDLGALIGVSLARAADDREADVS